MGPAVIFVPALLVAYLVPTNCQLNGVAQYLMPCFNVSAIPGITTPENRPPVTLNIFLEIIRRLEDANPTKSALELSRLFLQRLRQDGIVSTGRATDTRWALPFSPYGYESIKQSILTERFISNSSLELLYGDLNPSEICSFHYMISSTMNVTRRGDEASTCTRSARYTSRLRRDLDNSEITEAVEEFQPRSFVSDSERSQCPTEHGVVYTNYGAIKAGQVLNGIATGFSPQTVSGTDNRYAATITGEIVEAAFIQGTEVIEIGAQGGWNSTISPKYYFLQRNERLDLTDAEIRGSLDGLFMALRIDNWKSIFADLKISQILDLFYSPQQKGVFDSSFEACNRNLLFTEMTSTEKLRTETINLMTPLYATGYPMGLISINSEAFPELGNASVEAFLNYLPRLTGTDLVCSPMDSYIERVATDLLIFIDSSWNYNVIQSVLSTLLFLTIIHLTSAKNVQITNLKDNPGILPFRLGTAKIKVATHTFLHYVDFQPISEEIEELSRQYNIIKSSLTKQKDLSTTYLTSLHQYTEQHIDYQLKLVKEKLQSVYPLTIRKKRGLINGLGNIVKYISGNLDQEDAERYDAAIEKLQNDKDQIVNSLNQQISLTHKILENNNRTFSLMVHNQYVIKESIEELSNNSTYFLSLIDTYTQIKFNLDTLLSILTNIENAISFAKLGTLHHSIVSMNDIKSIFDSLLKYHSKDQLVYSEINDIYKQYDITPVDAYFSKTKLVFALHIPLVHPDTFIHYHLYSIPTQNFTTIIPKNSYFTMSNDMFQYDSEPCRNLNPDYLCENNYLIDGTQESDCIFSILQVKYNEAVCQTATIVVNKPLIEEVSESNYIAVFPQQQKVQTRCDETDFVMLKGAFLIEIPYQCSIETSGHGYTNEKGETRGKPLFLPEITIHQQIMEETKLQVDDISLDELHEVQLQGNRLQPLDLQASKHSSHHPWTIPLYIIVIMGTIYICLNKFMKFKKRTKDDTQPQQLPEVLFVPTKTSS